MKNTLSAMWIDCPKCGSEILVAVAGRTVKCYDCQTLHTIGKTDRFEHYIVESKAMSRRYCMGGRVKGSRYIIDNVTRIVYN